MWKRKKLQYKIPATSSSYYINSEYFRSCKKTEKLALLITSEDSLTSSKIKLLLFH